MDCRRLLPTAFSRLLVLSLVLALPASRAGADLLLTVRGHTDGFKVGDRTQEPRDADVKIWLSAEKMRRDEGPLSAIVRLDRHKLYLVNHTDKTYSVVDLPVDWAKLVPSGDREKFQQFVTDSQMRSTITPSTEAKKIHDWNAHRVDVELANKHGLKVSTHMWVTKDLPLATAYNKMSGALASLQVSSGEWAHKLGQLDGFPVAQDTTVSVGGTSFQSREDVVTADTKTVPDVTYDPPAGFNPIPYDPFRPPG